VLNQWCTAAPLISDYNDVIAIDHDIDFGNQILLCKAPRWFKDLEQNQDLDKSIKDAIQNTDFIIIKNYEATNLGDPDPEWQGKEAKSIQDKSQEEILLANLSLWLAKPSCLQFKVILYNQNIDNVWITRQGGRIDPIIYNEIDSQNQLSESDFALVKKILTSLCKLNRTQQGTIWFSVIDLLWALVVKKKEIRFILLWIALESLFGPKDSPQELTYRISQRVAFFLAENIKETRSLYETIINSYRLRSKIIHGREMFEKGNEKNSITLKEAEELVRKSLVKILIDDDLIQIFNSTNRDKYLNNLIFTRDKI